MPEPVIAAEPQGSPAAQPATQPTDSPASAPQSQDKPFFSLDDGRNIWNTPEDLKKSILETKNSYLELSPYKRWYSDVLTAPPEKGGFGLSAANPEEAISVVTQLLDELAELRYREQQGKVGSQPPANGTDAPQGLESLPKEWQDHIAFLTSKAGVVTKTDLEKMFAERDEKANQSSHDARIEAAVSHGANVLKGLMEKEGLPFENNDVADMQATIEASILRQSRDRQNQTVKGSLEDRFLNGSDSDRSSIVEQEFRKALRFGEAIAKKANANYAKEKTGAIASQPKPLPAAGGAAPSGNRRVSAEERNAKLREILGQ